MCLRAIKENFCGDGEIDREKLRGYYSKGEIDKRAYFMQDYALRESEKSKNLKSISKLRAEYEYSQISQFASTPKPAIPYNNHLNNSPFQGKSTLYLLNEKEFSPIKKLTLKGRSGAQKDLYGDGLFGGLTSAKKFGF